MKRSGLPADDSGLEFWRRIGKAQAGSDIVGTPIPSQLMIFNSEHDVRIDYPRGLARITCHSDGCEKYSISIDDETPGPVWHAKVGKFIEEHPTSKAQDIETGTYFPAAI